MIKIVRADAKINIYPTTKKYNIRQFVKIRQVLNRKIWRLKFYWEMIEKRIWKVWSFEKTYEDDY